MAGATRRVQRGLQDAASDISKGGEQILQGQIERGIENYGAGMANLYTGGGASSLGIKGETELTRKAGEQAAQEAADIAEVSAAEKEARLAKIRHKLEAGVALRQKSPGRSQTLLTSNLVPNTTNTKTLLTSTIAGMGKR